MFLEITQAMNCLGEKFFWEKLSSLKSSYFLSLFSRFKNKLSPQAKKQLQICVKGRIFPEITQIINGLGENLPISWRHSAIRRLKS